MIQPGFPVPIEGATPTRWEIEHRGVLWDVSIIAGSDRDSWVDARFHASLHFTQIVTRSDIKDAKYPIMDHLHGLLMDSMRAELGV